MTDEPTPKELDDLFVEETGFDTDDFPAAIFGFARAVLAKWGQPAPVGVGEVAEHYRNAIARACEGWTMPDGLRKHLETALWSPPTPQPTQPQAGAAEEIDKALNVYAQAFAARVNGWTRQNGDDLPGARSALFAAIHAYAQASTRPTTSPQADSVQEDAACWHWMAEYIVGTRTDLDDEIVASETVNDLRKLVKAAIKQGASHENQNQRPHRRST